MKRNILGACAGLALLFLIYLGVRLLAPLPIGNKGIEIEIPRGSTFRQAADIFAAKGIIRDKNFFLIMGRFSGIDRKMRAGFYSIYPSMTHLGLLKVLKKGQIIEYQVTIVEGDSLREIEEKLDGAGIVGKEQFQSLCEDREFMSAFAIDAPTIEGYLFPDTYKIPKGMDPKEAVGMMISRMKEKYKREFVARGTEIGLSERDVLTLASIIEKEAVTDDERPLISAVYHNRLKKDIPLQADPTAVYGIKSCREKITYSDLKRKTPYNTYRIKGLPPGPIANPGIKSIRAALYPAKAPYLYFVSNNDGTHHFSATYEEHFEAVKAYREKRQQEMKEEMEATEVGKTAGEGAQ